MEDISENQTTKCSFGILLSLSLAHLLSDSMQSIINAVYPLLKDNLNLDFAQIGMIAFVYQISASIMQPLFGIALDKKPNAWSLPVGLLFTMAGLLGISFAQNFASLLISVFFSGIGSSILHPEASRLTSLASGGKRGLAQSIFQVGGSLGFSLGPMLAALYVSPYGQKNISYFAVLAFIAIIGLIPACKWYSKYLKAQKIQSENEAQEVKRSPLAISKNRIVFIICILLILIFSKNIYTASLANYYTFYLMQKFAISLETSQMFLFAFLFASALGTLLGGPFGDKYGRRLVIWCSILGAAPFALLMPYANLEWTLILSMLTGFVISSAFPAILVYAQELLPFKLGFVSGLFFGLAFGFAGIAAAIIGKLVDLYGLYFVYKICALMPLMGFIAYFLPRVRNIRKKETAQINATTKE